MSSFRCSGCSLDEEAEDEALAAGLMVEADPTEESNPPAISANEAADSGQQGGEAAAD